MSKPSITIENKKHHITKIAYPELYIPKTQTSLQHEKIPNPKKNENKWTSQLREILEWLFMGAFIGLLGTLAVLTVYHSKHIFLNETKVNQTMKIDDFYSHTSKTLTSVQYKKNLRKKIEKKHASLLIGVLEWVSIGSLIGFTIATIVLIFYPEFRSKS